MSEKEIFVAVMIVAFFIWVVTRFRSLREPGYRTEYRVCEFDDLESFEKGLNRTAKNGWELDSWDTEPLYDWETIKSREAGSVHHHGHSSFQVYRVIFTKEVSL